MNNTITWYSQLIKPTWAPPSWVFGPIWSVLYIIIAVSFSAVFYKVYTKEIPMVVVLPFVLNLVFNIAFTPLQFGLRSNTLASLDILLILATLVWALYAIYPYMKWVTYVNAPYLIWVCIATVLQLTITYLNW